MIGSLRGRLIIKRPDGVIIETGGVGYNVKVPTGILSELPDEGNDIFLFIHTSVKEDSIELYGFIDEAGRSAFKTLLGVTGVGPKLALNVLSGSSIDDFLRAVETEDIGLLTRLPGVGKKTAQRIILELREKLPSSGEKKDVAFGDTLSALVNLGYRKTEAQDVLDKVYKQGLRDVESLLRESLKYLNK